LTVNLFCSNFQTHPSFPILLPSHIPFPTLPSLRFCSHTWSRQPSQAFPWHSISLWVFWCSHTQRHKASTPPLIQPPSDDDSYSIGSPKTSWTPTRRRLIISSISSQFGFVLLILIIVSYLITNEEKLEIK